MSKKIRYAKFPLDCKAFDDANKETYRAHSDLKPGEKLTMGRKHGHHRETWMNAYIESLKKQGKEPKNYISVERQYKKPGELVADCKSSKTKLKTGTLLVTVLDAAKAKPINEATVLIRGPGPDTATTGYDGKVAFDNVPIGTYNVSGLKDLYADEKQKVEVHQGKQAKVTLRLKRAQKEWRKIDYTVVVKGHDYNKKTIYLLLGATVTLRNEKGFDIRQGKTDRNGKVVFTAIQPGKYQLLISRKDYISRKVNTQVVIKHPQVLEVTLRYKWQAITFYLVLNTLDIIVGRKSKGVLYATTEGSRYNWECKCTSIGWTLGGGVGSIDTIGTTLHYDPFVFDLIHYWRKKDISLRSAGFWAWIIITDAMPSYSDWEKRPIKEAKFYDPHPGKRHLRIRFKQKDGAGEIGGYSGSGEIRFVKQTIKIIPVIPPLPGQGRQRIEEA